MGEAQTAALAAGMMPAGAKPAATPDPGAAKASTAGAADATRTSTMTYRSERMSFLPPGLRSIFQDHADIAIAIHDATEAAWGCPRIAIMIPGVHSIILPASEPACQFAAHLRPGAVLISPNLEASVRRLHALFAL